MSGWLDPPRNEAERALAQALEAARGRTGNEIARRRVWGRVADVQPAFVPRRTGTWLSLSAGGLLAAGLAAGGYVIWTSTTPAQRAINPAVPSVAVVDAPKRPVAPVADAVAVVRTEEVRLVLGTGAHRTRPREKLRGQLRMGTRVDVDGNSELVVAERKAAVKQGSVAFDVPPQPGGRQFVVAASSYRMVVFGTKFRVRVDGGNVGVDVDEGAVEIWRGKKHVRRVEGGDRWSASGSGRSFGVLARMESKPAAEREPANAVSGPAEAPIAAAAAIPAAAAPPEPRDVFREVNRVLANRDYAGAAELYQTMARGSDATAQTAAYELGRVYFTRLGRADKALTAWESARARFPKGVLRAETDLSIFDALMARGENQRALVEGEAFLARHARNERRSEIEGRVAKLRDLLTRQAAR